MGKRVILIVLDSCGIGGAKDAAAFGDEGSHTLAACSKDSAFSIANMKRIGMGCIEGALPYEERDSGGVGAWARLQEASMGKDTTIGHCPDSQHHHPHQPYSSGRIGVPE